MARKSKNKTKSPVDSRNQKAPKKPGKLLFAAGVFLSALLLAVMAAISMELAVLGAGFLGLCAIVMLENNRRRLWEYAVSFKFHVFGGNHEKLVREVARNRNDIAVLKESMAETAMRIEEERLKTKKKQNDDDPLEDITEPLLNTGRKPRSSSLDRIYEEEFLTPQEKSPRALKPAQKIRKAPSLYSNISNDEEMLPELSDMVVKELVHHAVRNERIDVFVQPIVRLPQRKTRFYEMYARIRAKAGVYLPAAQYMGLARKDALINDIDTMLLMECLKTLRTSAHIKNAAPFFLNITTDTLKNMNFMKRLLAFLANNRVLAPRLVFEIKQSDYENMQPAILEVLRGLARLGCAFSLDNVEELEFDIKLLQVLSVRFVKIPARVFLEKTANERDFTEMWRIKRKLEGNGIAVIAEKIESEHALVELLDFNINYGQGYLFGKPDLQGAYQQKRAA